MMATLVCAHTCWSCSLACIESILIDNGIEKRQSQMISELGASFPRWENQPGWLGTAEYERFFDEVGFPVTIYGPKAFADSITALAEADTVGAILTTQQFWENATKAKLVDKEHAMRLLQADSNGLTVMNPCRCPAPGIVENYSWEVVASFRPQALIFKRRDAGDAKV